jgi:hypothetical protein
MNRNQFRALGGGAGQTAIDWTTARATATSVMPA